MTLLRFAAAFLLLLAFPCSPVLAESGNERPKIGLALSGGGARGGAHVGILKALEELDIPIDYIAGTSMGAIVGGLYAAGYDAAGIETILKEIDWTQAMSDQPARRDRAMRKKELEAEFLIPFRVGFNRGGVQLPLGLIEGQHLDQVFHELLMPVMHVKQFDQLPIPFRAVATDLVTGEEFVLSQGSLPDSLRASMSVPGVFAPVRIGDRLLVDGGMSNNLPVSVVREMGADIVIAVNLNSDIVGKHSPKKTVATPPESESEEAGSMLQNLKQATRDYSNSIFAHHDKPEDAPRLFFAITNAINIVQDRITRSRLAGDPAEVVLSPRLAHIGMLEFHHALEAIAEGESCVQKALTEIHRLLGKI